MLEFPALLLLGFIVGLSGAVIPGPLLAFVIFDTARKRKVTGHFIIAGHALWEALIIFLILLGLGSIMLQYKLFIYVVGGVVLILMGVLMVRSGDNVKIESSKVNSSLLGGVFYTAFNPTQPPWWASAGLALLLQGYELLGNIGIITVTAGHWLADLTYYALISYMVYKYGKFFIPRRRQISLLLGVFVAVLGAYFIINGAMA
ncbi:MAG: LysE family transporter [Candidatus Bathyarchaeia archaeon]